MNKPAKIAKGKKRKKVREPKIYKRRSIDFSPPEGVPIHFTVATMGSRFGAVFLDLLITYGSMIILFIFLANYVPMSPTAWWTLFSLLTFLMRIPYYIFTEMVWNGRTLGKRIVGIRVVSAGGRRLKPYQVTVRNLLKEVEFFTPLALILSVSALSGTARLILSGWLLVLVLVPLFNKKRQRIGDIVAGTVVVETPKSVLLRDLALASKGDVAAYNFLPIHLDHYGRYELQTLERILHSRPTEPAQMAHVEKVFNAIIKKIGYTEPVGPTERLDFLFAFYKAQREHLEGHQLFGEVRENKFHAEKKVDKKEKV